MKQRIPSFLLAGLMALSLTVPALAADITIDGSGDQYQAYRLLNLTTGLKTDVDHTGDHTHTSACHNYAYTVNGTYRAALQAALPDTDADSDGFKDWDNDKNGVASDDEILSYLGSLNDNSDGIRSFADAVYAQVKDMTADETSNTNNKFSAVDQGYYLIVEKTTAADPDSRSLVMLDTAGQDNITVQSKEGVPVLTKQVQEVNDSTGFIKFQDAADADINDNVKFSLTGNFPDNISSYTSYKYIIHDSLDTCLTLDESSIKVSMGGKELTKDTDYTVVTSGLDTGCTFEIRIADAVTVARAHSITLTKSTAVNVEYAAKLTDSADLGNPGNRNVAHLEFSNDPYDTSSTSNTTPDKVKVFTYQLTVNKVDVSKNPLPGAGFKLQKFNGTDYVDYLSDAKAEGKSTFTFTGLDSGKYKLVETDIPAGYREADDVEFEVVATYPAESEDASLTVLVIKDKNGNTISGDGEGFSFSTVVGDGEISTTIVNSTGIKLPSTGGAGAYFIYAAGILAVAVGVVVFIPKKKHDDDEA